MRLQRRWASRCTLQARIPEGDLPRLAAERFGARLVVDLADARPSLVITLLLPGIIAVSLGERKRAPGRTAGIASVSNAEEFLPAPVCVGSERPPPGHDMHVNGRRVPTLKS
jgi:hypothetical protein